MKDQIAVLLTSILQDLGVPNAAVEVTVPEDPSHGDYTTNVAMTLVSRSEILLRRTKTLKKSPMEVALQVKKRLRTYDVGRKSERGDQKIYKHHQTSSDTLAPLDTLSAIDHVEVVPPGFLNIFLTEASLITRMERLLKSTESVRKPKERRRVMVEFAHPNTHKAFHIGHLRNITTGESIIRLLESQGNQVIRANYQGDVGMHIAKCLYGILQVQSSKFKVQSWKDAEKLSVQERVEYLGEMYAAGSKVFEEDTATKEEIVSLNALIYASAQRLAKERGIDPGTTDYLAFVKVGDKDKVEIVYTLWKETRQWSLDYFETIYKRVGSRYDRYYFESECLAGVDLAHEAVKKGVLKRDAGAIIFDGKPFNLDTRVFVNSLGLPTYEGKELKLATMETTEHGKLDHMIHVVGPEQASFFQVTFKAEELLGIVKPSVQHHLIYGWVKLKHGKMSSRSGNVVLGEWLLDEAKKAIYNILEKSESKYTKTQQEEIAEKAAVAAVKYAFLKVGTTSEIAFDIAESVNFQGDSGPYLQYTYARCKSVLRKSQIPNLNDQQGVKSFNWKLDIGHWTLNAEERSVLRLLTHFPDVVAEAAETFSPSTVCTYLFKLSQCYNLFYAKHSILGVPFRLALTAATTHVLKTGLYLLGIETLEQM